MSANIDYSDFNISTFNDTETGSHFIWGGELYQKVKPFHPEVKPFGEDAQNVIRPRDGEAFSFFGEEQVVPVDVNLEVKRRSH
jgi:hypothetical protein